MPHAPRLVLALSLGLSLLTLERRGVQADTSPVVARVGDRTITAAELERRMANVPAFQLRTFGNTPDEIKRGFLERVMVREVLFAQGAEARGLAQRDDVRERMRGVMRTGMLTRIKEDVLKNAPPTESDVKAYYEKNSAKYRSPPRVALWQIVVARQEEAREILAEMKKDPTPKRWNDLARDKSLDKVTNMRGGNLGFVLPDGSTNEPGVRVSPEVVKAADTVKDTELVPEPVKDGDKWVVVWRRQSMKPIERPLELETGSIRQLLLHERTDAKIKETIAALRKSHLRDHAPELLDVVDVNAGGELSPVRRPGAMPSGRRVVANPVPAPSSLR